MIRGLYTSASGVLVTQQRMDVATNNLANVNTPGFKERMHVTKSFPENRIVRTDDQTKKLSFGTIDRRPHVGPLNTGVADDGTYLNFTQGPLEKTDNPLDMAIQGEGFFVVEGENGERYYTRDGGFQINSQGELVNSNGLTVLGETGPIEIPEMSAELNLANDGTLINDQNEVLGRLEIAQFENPQRLENLGRNLFSMGEENSVLDRLDMADFTVRQGFLEGSNTDPIREMVNIIEINRLYEMNGEMIKQQNETVGQAVQQVGRV